MNALAVAHARARRRIRRAFEEKHAFSADRAIGFEPQRPLERRCFEKLLAAGAIVEVRPGSYRGDRDAWDKADRERRTVALALVGAAAAIGLALFGISQV